MNPIGTHSIYSPYLLSSIFNARYHQHLKHLNDLAFSHTKFLRDLLDRSSSSSLNSLKRPRDTDDLFHSIKKRRTKVTDMRITPKLPRPIDEISDDDHQSQSSNEIDCAVVLTSVHLRKAKLMFFYTRYPSSSMLKAFFPDVRFSKSITAQLVKWFSNFREFFYSQIEKTARQYLAEGVKHVDQLVITRHSDLFRILNIHYNRSNQIDVPQTFLDVAQITLREFVRAIEQKKDLESSWKKSIYKIIQHYDDQIPEQFKNELWM